MNKYRFEHGQLYLFDERGNILVGIPDNEFAILYSIHEEEDGSAGFVMHNHGPQQSVQKKFDEYRKTGIDVQFQMIAFRAQEPMVEDINRVIDTSGWLKFFFKKYGLMPA